MKKIAVATIIMGMSMGLIGCSNSTTPNTTQQPVTNEQKKEPVKNENTDEITVEEAKEIALKHANLKNDQVTFSRSEMDYDDGIQTYDIEFYLNNIEYNYEIDANTGNVLSYEQD